MLLLPLLLFLAVLAAFGWGVARIVEFPLGYLYFAEPTWRILIGPLQSLTARVAVLIGPLIGMPAVRSGILLHLPHGATFEVTPLCSGVNYLVVGLAIAALIGVVVGALVLFEVDRISRALAVEPAEAPAPIRPRA